MRIGVDFDGVIANLQRTMYDFLRGYYGESPSMADMTPEGGKKFFEEMMDSGKAGEDGLTALRFMTMASPYFYNSPLLRGCKEIVEELRGEDHTIVVVTSRYDYEAHFAKDYLRRKSFPHHHFVNVNEGENYSKKTVLKRLQLSCLLDDNPKHLRNLVKTDCLPVLFTREYNQHERLKKGIERVDGWYDFYERFKEWKESGKLQDLR